VSEFTIFATDMVLRRILSSFFLLVLLSTLIPFSVWHSLAHEHHSHDHGHEHHSLQNCEIDDPCHISISHHGSSNGKSCDHPSHFTEQEFECAVCDYFSQLGFKFLRSDVKSEFEQYFLYSVTPFYDYSFATEYIFNYDVRGPPFS